MTEAKIILAAAAAAAVLSVAAAGGAYLALSGSDERIARCDGGDGAGGLDTLGTEFTLTTISGFCWYVIIFHTIVKIHIKGCGFYIRGER